MFKKLMWTIFLVIVFILGYKLAPIYYRAFSLESVCQVNADLFHRYNAAYITQRLSEDLDRLGIPKNKRETALTKTKEAIIVEIYYEDTADFFGYYKKDYVFIEDCEGVLTSIVAQ